MKVCSDGDLMEGVSNEAASLAGQNALGKLIYFYDDNRITIDGTIAISFDGEDEGWRVEHVEDSEGSTRALAGDRALPHRLPGPERERLQITANHPGDARIPDEAGLPGASLSFGVLVEAPALGDRQALLDAADRLNRPAEAL